MINELSEKIKKCIQLGQNLPYSGFFNENESDVFKLVTRKALVQDIKKMIFGDQTFFEYIKDQAEQLTFDLGERNKTHIRFITSYKGFRFIKSDLYMMCTLDTDSHEYELVIPLTQENAELYVQGLVALAEPTKMLGLLEFGFTAKSKTTNRINKVHNKFSYSLQKGKNGDGKKDIEDIEYFNMAPMENAALLAFAMINQKRPLNPKLSSEDLELLRVWSLVQVNVHSYNYVNDLKPEPIPMLPEWETFEEFKKWAIANGYRKGYTLQRKENPFPTSTTLVWVEDNKVFPDRYYWHYFNNLRYAITDPEMPLTINGETRTVGEWSEITDLPNGVIIGRIFAGLTDQDIIAPTTEKVNTYLNQVITIDGVKRTAKEWAEFVGITPNTIASRIRYGWTGKDLISPPRNKVMKQIYSTN